MSFLISNDDEFLLVTVLVVDHWSMVMHLLRLEAIDVVEPTLVMAVVKVENIVYQATLMMSMTMNSKEMDKESEEMQVPLVTIHDENRLNEDDDDDDDLNV